MKNEYRKVMLCCLAEADGEKGGSGSVRMEEEGEKSDHCEILA